MRNIWKSAVVAGTLALGTVTAAQALNRDFTFVNYTKQTVVAGWMKPAGNSEWVRITFNTVLAPHYTKGISVPGFENRCRFDVSVEFIDGTFAYWWDADLCTLQALNVRA